MSEATGFTREAVEALSARLGEPDWLLSQRLAAFARFEQTPYPTTDHLEDWRRCDVSVIDFAALATPVRANGFRGSDADTGEVAGRLRFADGELVEQYLSPDLVAQGVLCCSLSDAVRQYPELVREHLMTRCVLPDEGKFTLLHAALWRSGVFVRVPDGVELAAPLVITVELGQGGGSLLHHNLVLAGERASVGVIEVFSGGGDAATLSVPVTEVLAGVASRVSYASVQTWGPKVYEIGVKRVLTERDASVDLCVSHLGGKLTKAFVGAVLNAPGSDCRLSGLYFPAAGQQIDQTTLQDHRSGECHSNLLFKGAVADRATSIFRGVINVHPDAQRTDAYQTNNNLLLGTGAEADSMPVLEILADDVKCSHGATLGHLDEEDLFYLMCRGLPRKEAQRMVIAGYFEPVIDRIPSEAVRSRVQQLVSQRIDAQAEAGGL